MTNSNGLLAFWHLMEKPKLVFRSARAASGREESDAEHMWRLAVMAMAVAPELSQPVNLERLLKLAIIHDICEMDFGDTPTILHVFDEALRKRKEAAERATMEQLAIDYPDLGTELLALWEEYERQDTFEAKVLKALDKLDARVSIIDDPLTANYSEERKAKGVILMAKSDVACAVDPALARLADLSREERRQKYGW